MSASRILSAQALFTLVCTTEDELREADAEVQPPSPIAPDVVASASGGSSATAAVAEEDRATLDSLVVQRWRGMIAAGEHRAETAVGPAGPGRSGSGWKAEYQMRRESSEVSPHEAFEDMTSA